METVITNPKKPRRTREEVIGRNTVDKTFRCSWDDINIVLNGWKKVKPNLAKLGVDIFQRFISEHLSYQNIFPSLANLPQDSLLFNEDFKVHSYAIMQGLNSVMKNLSGEYEEDNEILPVIGFTHQKRGVTPIMMQQLKECILLTLSDALQWDKRETAAWKTVLDFVFQEYIYKAYSLKEELDFLDN